MLINVGKVEERKKISYHRISFEFKVNFGTRK